MPALTQNPGYISGDWSTPVRISQTPKQYPFRALGNLTDYVYTAIYRQTLAKFTGTVAGTVDPENASAYLASESVPVPVWQGARGLVAEFSRVYTTLPATQTESKNLALSKPNPSAVGVSRGTLYDNTATDSGPSSQGSVYSYGGALFAQNKIATEKAASFSLTVPAGGTFTLTYKTSTTAALAYNAADGTINAAINGLASVIADGLTYAVSNNLSATGTININSTVGSTLSRITINAGSLTPAAASTGFCFINSPTSQNIVIGWRATLPAHGLNGAANLLAVLTGNAQVRLMPPTTWWVIVDSDTIAINNAFVGTYTFVGQYYRAYTAGPTIARSHEVQDFWLAGVTGGITTDDDIPVPAQHLSDADFLAAAIATTSGYVGYDAGPLDRWQAGKIRTRLTTAIDFSSL